uniref:Lipoprotein n=1 Tax=Candidatus Kentrum sp. LFY TaxID=2126342 RepID=A0A450UZY4_9GAMM|nr:MAG: hypothetical protein BECKLFY1418B_GA0070995_11144 [Candidatus Kentron sp. LFY]
MKNQLIKITTLAVSLSVAGCSLLESEPEYAYTGGGRVNPAGAVQMLPSSVFETFDLAVLLGEPALTSKNYNQYKCEEGDDPSSDGCIMARDRLDEAFKKFGVKNPGPRGKQRRNEIQDRLMAASEQRCNVYKVYLKRLHGKGNFYTGSLATILGGAGAIVTGVDGARILSGLAGITSGVRAEFNQAVFLNQVIPVITKGIEGRRKDIKTEIGTKRAGGDLTSYTVEAAIGDAIRYHGACTIVAGLSQAEVAIQELDNPGLETMNKVSSKITKLLCQQRYQQDMMLQTTGDPAQSKWKACAEEGKALPQDQQPGSDG